MPLNPDIKKVMVIGSGPIVIGQAAEFDYAGTQACRALKEEGLEVVLVNSNPATIMTDNVMADRIYIEPLTLPVLKRIIAKERPDSLLSTLGGQTGLTLSMQLAKEGFLDKMGVKLLGAKPLTIDKAEDRQMFKDTMEKIGQPCVPSLVVHDVENALSFANELGYPVVIRPAFTLGGTGGGIVHNDAELKEITINGLRLSPIHQVLVEKGISGWREIEFEVIRDSKGNMIAVCSMENFDPVGVHTGDSIVAAPALSLTDEEVTILREAALKIVDELEVEGGCNCQFALKQGCTEYAVIEVNPRVSRSSALASKATGYPIAKVAAKIAIGYLLDEIKNGDAKKPFACHAPELDYIVVKFPKWPFDKFVYAKRDLGTQMKATGEVMSIGMCFEEALMKAVRGAEIGLDSLNDPSLKNLSDKEIEKRVYQCTDERLFVVFEAIKRGISLDKIYDITKIGYWFLNTLKNLCDLEKELKESELTDELYKKAKLLGYLDKTIESISGKKIKNPIAAKYRMVSTTKDKDMSLTPYFYASYIHENEAADYKEKTKTDKKTVIVFGSGPIRIGQGIEFDYASVQCVWALKKLGFDVVIMNNNPETVSTDFDTADRLYFEPLTNEDAMNVVKTENPYGVVVAFGGQTAIKLTKHLVKNGVNILGTPPDAIDMAEDRERFDALLEELQIKRPRGQTVMTTDEAVSIAEKIGYPVLLRPSYVLGGQNMIIAFNEADIREYMTIILSQNIENPVLIDKYLMGPELEVDAICDGEDILIPGLMEHVERAGVHSGDSIAVYPAFNVMDSMREQIITSSKEIALSLKTKGLINIQYLIYENELYVIEVNPRSSRTVPYISKVTGVPMVELATRAMFGEKLKDMGFGTGLFPSTPYKAVKVPVFSFSKLIDVDNHLGPEMKSTGEVLGLATTFEEALYKGLVAAGYKMEKNGGIFISVRDGDKVEIADVAKKYDELGFILYATHGTAETLRRLGLKVQNVHKIHESSDSNTATLLESGKINYVISTSSKGRLPTRDSVKIRRKAVELSIPCLTAIDTANALADSLKSRYSELNTELVDINSLRQEPLKLNFTKMQGCGNDYIYFSCFDQQIDNPEGLSVRFADRHFGIGGDGAVLMEPSDIADARMRIYNIDGTEGKMCGNSIRCVGKYLYDNGIVKKEQMSIETISGIRDIKVYVRDEKVVMAKVNMGPAELSPALVPVKLSGDRIVNEPIRIGDEIYNISCVGIGNPHCVVFVDFVDGVDIEKIGPQFENHHLFPERVNTEFVRILSRNALKMRVWERGNGETWACGTGACAAVVAAVLNGYCDKDTDITVKLRGGDLVIRYTDDAVYMTGNCETIFEGQITI